MVTGVATVAVQVATTCVACGAESFTDGSLTVQFEFTSAAVIAGHPGLARNWNVAFNVSPFAGGAALWSTVAVVGFTFKPTAPQSEEFPPQPASPATAVHNKSNANLFNISTILPANVVLNASPLPLVMLEDMTRSSPTPTAYLCSAVSPISSFKKLINPLALHHPFDYMSARSR